MENLFKFLFPSKCINCGKSGDVICGECVLLCEFCKESVCIICGKPSPKGKTHGSCISVQSDGLVPENLFSVFNYSGVTRKCIKNAKFGGKNFSVLKILTQRACLYLEEHRIDLAGYYVTPIPLSRGRYKERGFNQAEVLAKLLAGHFGLKCCPNLLYRQKETVFQYTMSRKQRFENMKSAFAVKGNSVLPVLKENNEPPENKKNQKTQKTQKKQGGVLQGKSILLVDDICTSGSTFLEAAKAIYAAGATQVKCFSLAKKVLVFCLNAL